MTALAWDVIESSPHRRFNVVNNVDYFEIGSPDPEASRTFYTSLFGWQFGAPSTPARYSMVNDGLGGLWDTAEIGAGNWLILYVRVDDVRRAMDQASELGATVAFPLTDNGDIEFAHLVDPLGNRFGVWQPKS
jgi:uncharacterized protein